MKSMARSSLRRAFTLIELVVVVAILAVLAAAVLPGLANAATPTARPVVDLLEADLRRAKIEAMSALQPTQLVVAADRRRWWLQPLGELGDDRALPSSLRAFGFGALSPYEGFTLDIRINNVLADAEDVAIAIFDDLGSRDAREVEITIVSPATEDGNGVETDTQMIGDGSGAPTQSRWTLEAQRTRFQ
jgi:prepilin-type N-terminal cleavage/methylation domain-containing protein